MTFFFANSEKAEKTQVEEHTAIVKYAILTELHAFEVFPVSFQ
jgi:hypothetical protein